MDNENRCGDCAFWKVLGKPEKIDKNHMGRCIAHPPSSNAVAVPQEHKITHQMIMSVIDVTTYPQTAANCEACGEFKHVLIEQLES